MNKIQIPTTDGHKEINIRMDCVANRKPHIAVFSDNQGNQSMLFRYSYDDFLNASEERYGMTATFIDHMLKLQSAINKRIAEVNKKLTAYDE